MRRFALCPRPRLFLLWTAVSLVLTLSLPAQQRQMLRTNAAAPSNAQLLGRLPSSQQLPLSLSLPLRNQDQLKALLSQLGNPASPNYRHFLTAKEFTEQFGPTTQDYAKVVSFAKAHGLTVTHTFANRLLVNVSGPAASVEQTFHVKMQSYQHPTENRKFYAPDVEPSIDSGVPLLTVNGLSTANLPHSMLKHALASENVHSDTTGSGQGGAFLGSDMRAAYVPDVTLDGNGQTVGLIELGPYNLSDVQSYFSTIGQPLNVPIYNVLLDVDGICSGTPTTGGCDDGEEVADIEQAISMAPHLSGLIVYEAYGSGSDALTAFTQAANDDVAKQLSLSFGWGGTPSTEPGYEQVFMELAAQGQNVFVASGDAGANVGDIGYPGNSPNIIDVGGTDLTTAGAGGPWQSESAWIGSTGGWNTQSPIPSYQVPVVNSANQGSTSYRNVPDVAMEANTDNYFCANGQCGGGLGGTSLAAPRWAGFLALVNQQANGNPIAFLNQTVYSIGQGSSYTSFFHDIVTGNNFNSGSPDMFSAVQGYDLTTGWGTPTGQNMINILAPFSTGSPNFSLTASPGTLSLTPGESGTSTITLSALNGFNGTVDFTVTEIGAPAGVTATLNPASITGSGSATLNVTTTSGAPGGNLVVAITGASGGLTQTTYVQLALPTFSLSASPSSLYINQNDVVTDAISVIGQNGFDGRVKFSPPGGLPDGVYGVMLPGYGAKPSTLALAADGTAITGPGREIAVTGTSGNITETIPALTLAVSAATGYFGQGTPVDLSSAYNVTGVYTDGTAFTSGGLDGGGFALSANILTKSRVLNGVPFKFGPANASNAVYGTGQTIALPEGRFTSLQMLATGIEGNQASQIFTVTYTDGTTSQFTQSYSDWFSPSINASEAEAVAMPYRNTASGAKDNRQFNLYGYTFVLNSLKSVKSVTLPNNRNVVILAATLSTKSLGTQVDLSSAFNAAGIYTDGTAFPSDGGLDAGGAAYSANLLNDVAGSSHIVADGVEFNLGAPNTTDAAYGTGKSIKLPAGHFTKLHILATGVQGSQTAQPIVVTYTDGSTSTLTQSFSDWFSPQNFSGENVAVKMAYRNLSDGSQNNQAFNLYEYTLKLNSGKIVKTLELPSNRNVVTLGISLTSDSVLDGVLALPRP
jgi:hypothetical protein